VTIKSSKQEPNFLKQKPINFAPWINGGNQATIDWTIETFQCGNYKFLILQFDDQSF
jgi:hypothetical protein